MDELFSGKLATGEDIVSPDTFDSAVAITPVKRKLKDVDLLDGDCSISVHSSVSCSDRKKKRDDKFDTLIRTIVSLEKEKMER